MFSMEKTIFGLPSAAILMGALVFVEFLVPLLYGDMVCQTASKEAIVHQEYLAEIVLSEAKPFDKTQPKEVYPILLANINFEERQACIEIDNRKGGWEKYCAKEGEYLGTSHGIKLKKVTRDSVVIHLYWGGKATGEKQERVECDWVPSQPIHLAAAQGDLQKLKKLLENNSTLLDGQDEHRMTPVAWAAYRGQDEMVKFLLTRGVGQISGRFDRTPLHFAIQQGHKQVAEILLNHQDVDVNAKDIFGATPLYSAVLSGRKDLVEILIANGADVSHIDENGWTPLHSAVQAYNKNVRIVKLLLSNGSFVNAKDGEGKTSLHWAAEMGRIEIAELLLTHKADINAKDASKSTPLHLAAKNGHVGIIKLLLVSGANVNAREGDNKTSLELAAQGDFNDVVEVIKKWKCTTGCQNAESKEEGSKEQSTRKLEPQVAVKKQDAEIHQPEMFTKKTGIDTKCKDKQKKHQVIHTEKRAQGISKPIFGIHLGETLEDLKKRFHISPMNAEDVDLRRQSQWWQVDQHDKAIDYCSVEVFENRVFRMQVKFSDGSKTHFKILEEQLEKKFGRPEVPRHFDYKRRYVTSIDGSEVKLIIQGRYGITVDATHVPLYKRLSNRISEIAIQQRHKKEQEK